MSSLNRSKHYFDDFAFLALGGVLFLIAGFTNQRTSMPKLQLSKQETAINVNQDLLTFLSAGNKRLFTDLLWVQTLLESDLEHYGSRDLNNWMYLRFKTIAALDPLFYENYAWGGQYLSIVKDDLEGAVNIYKMGLKYFPDNYFLNYNLGFTYYFELGDYKQGLGHMERIQYHPKAPKFIPTLVLKMKAELGFDFDGILSIIYDLRSAARDEILIEKLSSDYHALKAERDIRCLNEGRKNCEAQDSYGQPYVFAFGKYHSQTPFIPYRLKRRGDNKKTESVTTF